MLSGLGVIASAKTESSVHPSQLYRGQKTKVIMIAEEDIGIAILM